MSRVEPKDERDQIDRRGHERSEQERQAPPAPTPSKSEGEESAVDEALRKEH